MVFGIVVAAVALLVASVEDIRKREVPDLVSFSVISLGIGIALLESLYFHSWFYLIFSVAGIIAAAIIGAILYYSGQWGGGDFKLIMGMGSLIGFNFLAITDVPALALFLINSLLVGSILGIVWVLYLSIKNRKSFKKEFFSIRTSKENKKTRIFFIIFIPVVFIIMFITPIIRELKILFILVALFSYLFYYLSMYIRAVEKSSMVKRIPVKKLTEGDWIVNVEGKPDFKQPKTGVSRENINSLLKSKVRFVSVKEGMPFVPSFLIAYAITLVLGNWLLFLRF